MTVSPVLRCDPTNPGQFLACCGVLELAHRRFGPWVRGWFSDDSRSFFVSSGASLDASTLHSLLRDLCACELVDAMNVNDHRGSRELDVTPRSETEVAGNEDDVEESELPRESPVTFGSPFGLTVDWYLDARGGGKDFKTWAGQQTGFDIARRMQSAARNGLDANSLQNALTAYSLRAGRPFNFDSDLGTQGAALDVGFSLDPLRMGSAVRPVIELCAFIALQRFRPARLGHEKRYQYALWHTPLPACVASAVASGSIDSLPQTIFEFSLLYRTQYLKSFLPAKPA